MSDQTLRIAESPKQDRPRERLQQLGADKLKLADLLAILIRSGRPGESAVQAGEKIASRFYESLERLPDASLQELKSISPAVAQTAYCQIMAGIELGRRVAEAKYAKVIPCKITGSESARRYCEEQFSRLTTDGHREEFHIITLDTKNQVITTHQISVGTLNASLVHPREVFKPAIKDSAASVILVHNHPSGDPSPSREDRQVTNKLEQAGQLLGIDVLDHIVLGTQDSCSLRESV